MTTRTGCPGISHHGQAFVYITIASLAASTESAPCLFGCLVSDTHIANEHVSGGWQVLMETELQAPDAPTAHHDDDAAVATTRDDGFE